MINMLSDKYSNIIIYSYNQCVCYEDKFVLTGKQEILSFVFVFSLPPKIYVPDRQVI